jgi:Asp-tRNA(Asn)/Glu-tRNA(Gln) amidotransferase A subunit family amidase
MGSTSRRRKAGIAGAAVSAILAVSCVAVAVPASAATQHSAGHAHNLPDPTTYTITQTLDTLKEYKLTSVQLTQDFLARIKKYEPYYNAFTQMNPDAINEAKASDWRRAKHMKPRPLEGVPIVIKDTLNFGGLPTTGAWPVTSPIDGGVPLIPSKNAPVVQRLLDAGAVILGKTNLPILAGSGNNANNSAYGPTFSILNQNWSPGGSSTGTAAAVAGDFAVAGIGEETGGSIQNPSSAESLFGVKTTFGLVPTVGNMPLAGSTRDVLGPIVKNPEDAAIMLNVMAGYTPADPKTAVDIGELPKDGYQEDMSAHALKGKRIGLYGPGWRSGANGVLSPETQALYDKAVQQLEAEGATVVEDPFAGSGFADVTTAGGSGGTEDRTYQFNQYLKGLGPTSAINSLAELKAWAAANGFGDNANLKSLNGDPDVEPDMSAFYKRRDAYDNIFNAVMKKYHLDGLFFPQETKEIGDIYTGGISSTTVSEINIAQLPGAVVPDGSYADGRPFSTIFVGPKFSEPTLLGFAYAFTQTKDYPGRVINLNLSTTPGPTPPTS